MLVAEVPAVAPRPLSARSVVASTLLGADPPELPVRTIVRCGGLFGIGEGAVRTAVSRMVADGSLAVDAERHVYRVAGRLLDRRARQLEGRESVGSARRWTGEWDQRIVVERSRPAAQRAALRAAASTLRLAELRGGVWLRPDNLAPDRHPAATDVVAAQTLSLTSRPPEPVDLAAQLWDLEGWSRTARLLASMLDDHLVVLDASDDPAVLADGFLLSAAVLRHLVTDPLLPEALSGPGWPGPALRVTYDAYDLRYKQRWRDWFRAQVVPSAT